MTLSAIFLAAAKWGVPALLGISTILGGFYTVPQKHKGLVSRFGKYTGSPKGPGLHFKIPFIDQVDAKVPLALQTIGAHLDTKTTDNQFVQLPINIQFNVEDAEKYFYDTDNPDQQIQDIVTAEVRKYTSQKEFQQLYDEREEISDAVIASVASELEDYGIKVHRIVIDEPQPDENTKEAYNDVRASERRKEAAKNNAEAKYIEMVEIAKADKERNQLIGEGIKAFRLSVAESYIETRAKLIEAGVDEKSADEFMAEAMRLDTMRDVGEKGNLIVMALEGSGSDASNASIPQVFAALKAHQSSVDKAYESAAPEQDNHLDKDQGKRKKAGGPSAPSMG